MVRSSCPSENAIARVLADGARILGALARTYAVLELPGEAAAAASRLGVQQQKENSRYPDLRGRFHDPDRPFGPPHASSTGVYLEGLTDAHSLAMALGDTRRAEAYRRAIVHGLRNVMQLQFDHDVDLFYVREGDRARVRGGIRTEAYDNRIRCDNVQHTLMVVLEILDRSGAVAGRARRGMDLRTAGEARSELSR
jgi:hypothetical protein